MALNKKTIGIVGGMGPEATADLFTKIIKNTKVDKDQDHIRVVIDSNTNIPDRTAAILGRGPSPVTELSNTAQNLIEAGAEILVMPCNTAHYFYPRFAVNLPVKFLHMMQETVRYITENYPDAEKVGLLATSGTVGSGIYRQALEDEGLTEIVPAEEVQSKVMEAIYAPWGIKAGHYDRARDVLREAGEHLVAQGAEIVIMGCTEIPLVLNEGDLSVPVLDATDVLAKAAVKEALGSR